MSKRLLAGMLVLAAAVAVGLGIWLLGDSDEGSGEQSPETSTPIAAADDDPASPEDGDPDKPDGKSGKRGGKADGESKPDGGSEPIGASDEPEPEGPPIKQDEDKPDESPSPVGPSEDVDAVSGTLTTYLSAIRAGNGQEACDQLSASGLRTMEKKLAQVAPETRGSECAQSILLYQGAYGDALENPKITGIEVSGDTATALGPLQEPARLSRGEAGWLIDEYGR